MIQKLLFWDTPKPSCVDRVAWTSDLLLGVNPVISVVLDICHNVKWHVEGTIIQDYATILNKQRGKFPEKQGYPQLWSASIPDCQMRLRGSPLHSYYFCKVATTTAACVYKIKYVSSTV